MSVCVYSVRCVCPNEKWTLVNYHRVQLLKCEIFNWFLFSSDLIFFFISFINLKYLISLFSSLHAFLCVLFLKKKLNLFNNAVNKENRYLHIATAKKKYRVTTHLHVARSSRDR